MTDRRNTIAFCAILLAVLATGAALGGAVAHLFELPNKIGMDRDTYFTVQAVYNGWNQLAYILVVELVSLGVAIWAMRHHALVRSLLLGGLVFFIASQVIFWAYTFPANGATENWTQIPDNWEALRAQWEYSHAAGAICQFVVLIFVALAALNFPKMREAT